MFKRINSYLLTHYPLLWNSRIVWVMAANLIIHTLFFLAGLGAVRTEQLQHYYNIGDVGDGGMVVFSILCTILVLLVWLIYFLRNNPLKLFYHIGRWHLLTEFFIMLVIIYSSMIYFDSFNWGVRTRLMQITPEREFVQEVNTLNRAMMFVPINNEDYFILRNCQNLENGTDLNTNFDTTTQYTSAEDINRVKRIKAALRRPDAFSYMHYCRQVLEYRLPDLLARTDISSQNAPWLSGGKEDSVKTYLKSLLRICGKYGIQVRIPVESLSHSPFSSPYHSVTSTVNTEQFSYTDKGRIENEWYIETGALNRAMDIIYEAIPTPDHNKDHASRKLVEWYIALSLTILLLCYRRFSRRVFLLTMVGAVVWTILVALFMIGAHGESSAFYSIGILLNIGYASTGIILLKGKGAKTWSGAFLSWHAILIPYLIAFIYTACNDRYRELDVYYSIEKYGSSAAADRALHAAHPVFYWINEHGMLIFTLNWIIVVAYLAFLFNRWGKEWQLKAAE